MEMFPFRTTLHRNDRGLYTRIRLNGDVGYGKIFLPDRTCKGLHEGLVLVKSIVDKGSYGFFVGEMIKEKSPTDEEVSRYIIDNSLHGATVSFCESETLGSYALLEGVGSRKVLVQGKGGKAEQNLDVLKFVDTDNHEVKEKIDGCDLICQGYQGCNFKDLLDKMTVFPFRSYSAVPDYVKFISDLFDDAIDLEILTLKVLHGVEFVEVDSRSLLCNLHKFDRDEMTQLIETVCQINLKATERTNSLIKKGKISLSDAKDLLRKGRFQ